VRKINLPSEPCASSTCSIFNADKTIAVWNHNGSQGTLGLNCPEGYFKTTLMFEDGGRFYSVAVLQKEWK
jgi:hypothetical protein